MNGIERAIGKLEGRVDGIEQQAKAIFQKIEIIDGKREKDKNDILDAIAAHPPCNKVVKLETELKDHKGEHKNNLTKVALLASFITLAWNFIKDKFIGN